jgi:ATP-dependent DNA helicase RecG
MNLNSPLSDTLRILPAHKKAMDKLGLKTVRDLLYHFPVRYGDTKEIKYIGTLVAGEEATVFGTVTGLKMSKGFRSRIPMSEATLSDETGKIKLVWFHQPYIAKMLHESATVRVQGKVSEHRSKTKEQAGNGTEFQTTAAKGNAISVAGRQIYFSNPKVEVARSIPVGVGKSLFGESGDEHSLYPVYPESAGVTSNWIYHAVEKIFRGDGAQNILENLEDTIPTEILQKYNLPSLKTALIWIHTPKNTRDAESARKRFAFEEIFFIQLQKQRDKKLWQSEKSFEIAPSKKSVDEFLSRFPFTPTEAQKKAIDAILSDFKKGHPMSRLLEGDVGSGKTLVAAVTAFAVATSRPNGQDFGNLQVAYMAPTEILAKQHYENFIQYFKHLPIKIGLLTGSGCQIFPSKSDKTKPTKISRPQLLKWVANGEVPILIGTHALIYKSVVFKHLAFVVIDEQHRFGTAQRQKLTTKSNNAIFMPHLLTMTATPIPRTLALTIYGDLDLTLLDQMPAGRKPIITKIILPQDRQKTYNEISDELENGRQLYVICPRIDEPDPTKELAIIAKSVKMEAELLKKDVFQKWNIGILHSKMTPEEKEKMMQNFLAKKIDILVATSVVEVGVNVQNATMIIIEGAERFGLSQLHQLRGRVIRSNHQAYCFVFTESHSDKTRDRLKALTTAKNGFELSEFDLAQRGSGELYGRKQWGISDLAMEAIKNIKMVEAARLEATTIIDSDPSLAKHPTLLEHISNQTNQIHFE